MTTEGKVLSLAQIDRLGERLRSSLEITEADLRVLQQFRQEHVTALRAVQEGINEALGGVAQTSRIKTIQTLHDKLTSTFVVRPAAH